MLAKTLVVVAQVDKFKSNTKVVEQKICVPSRRETFTSPVCVGGGDIDIASFCRNSGK